MNSQKIIEEFRKKFPSINLNTNQDTKEPFDWVFVSGQKDLPLKIKEFLIKVIEEEREELCEEIEKSKFREIEPIVSPISPLKREI